MWAISGVVQAGGPELEAMRVSRVAVYRVLGLEGRAVDETMLGNTPELSSACVDQEGGIHFSLTSGRQGVVIGVSATPAKGRQATGGGRGKKKDGLPNRVVANQMIATSWSIVTFNVRKPGQRIVVWALGYTTIYKDRSTAGQEGTRDLTAVNAYVNAYSSQQLTTNRMD